jgi:glycerophosphoryl diester phosphodiesterase
MHAADTNSAAHKLINSNRPLVIGHRGYSQFAPENTLASFKLAIAAGADLVELDYRHSHDDQLVVIHDRTVDRTTNGCEHWRNRHIKVDSKTAAQLQGLDAGHWFASRYAGVRVPLLAESLDTIQKSAVTLIERKAGEPEALIALLSSKRLINSVVVQSFDWGFLRELHQRRPDQVLGALGPPTFMAVGRRPALRRRQLNTRWLLELEKTGAKIAVWNHRVSPSVVDLAHRRGLKVWIYTVNDPDLANHLLNIGVDGLITNNISLIWRTIALRRSRQE